MPKRRHRQSQCWLEMGCCKRLEHSIRTFYEARIATTVYEAFGLWRAEHWKGVALDCWQREWMVVVRIATTVYGDFCHRCADRGKGMELEYEQREWMVVARIAATVYEAFGHCRADHRKGKTLLNC